MLQAHRAPFICFFAAACLVCTACAGNELSAQSSADADAQPSTFTRDTRSQRPIFAASSKTAREIPPQACSEGFEPQADAALGLSRLAAPCAQSKGLIAITPVHTGIFGDTSSGVDRFQFKGRKDHCYRILSVGEAGIIDLDIAVLDSNGRLAAADLSSDAFPIVPPRGFLCLKQEETFTIQVAAQQGNGRYVLQIWGSP